MKLVAGLGNPGNSYLNTRHNVGFLFINEFRKSINSTNFKNKKSSKVCTGTYYNQKLVIVKPVTYMNLSGIPILEFTKYYKISSNHIIIVYDDTYLPLGKIRIRESGSSGGHKGIKSIIEAISNSNFTRIKIGIGTPPSNIPLEKFVLMKFNPDEFNIINDSIKSAIKAVKLILRNKLSQAMNEFN